MNQKRHLVIFRTSGSIIDYKTYNCQEIGLAKSLTQQGFKVSVIMAGVSGSTHKIGVDPECFIDLYYLPFKAINQSICYFKGYKTLLKKLSPDIIQVHEFGMLMSYLVLKWAKQNNCKTVLIQGNYTETQKPILKQLELTFNHFIGQRALKLADKIGCKTIMAGNYVRRYSSKQVCLTPIGLDTSKFITPTSIDWREKLAIDSNKKVLLYVGAMEQRRNVLFLEDLVSKLSGDYILIMVGDGPLLKELKEEAHKKAIDKKCLFLGKLKQEELPSLYATADLFLLASNYEIYGMVILEAMYFGLPVVSSLTAGSETIISNQKDGVIINTINEKNWKEEIESIYLKNKLSEFKIEATKTIQDKFTWEKAMHNFIKLY